MKFELEIPTRADVNQNARLHPMARHRLTKSERRRVAQRFPKRQLRPLVRVTLIRLGPQKLDDDNNAGALKATRDAIARCMNVDDRSPLVEWCYEQEPAREYSVRVVVEAIGELPPDTRPPPKPWQLPPVESKRAAPKNLRALATPATYRPGGKR